MQAWAIARIPDGCGRDHPCVRHLTEDSGIGVRWRCSQSYDSRYQGGENDASKHFAICSDRIGLRCGRCAYRVREGEPAG